MVFMGEPSTQFSSSEPILATIIWGTMAVLLVVLLAFTVKAVRRRSRSRSDGTWMIGLLGLAIWIACAFGLLCHVGAFPIGSTCPWSPVAYLSIEPAPGESLGVLDETCQDRSQNRVMAMLILSLVATASSVWWMRCRSHQIDHGVPSHGARA